MPGIDATLVEIEGGLYDIQIDESGDIQSENSFDTAILVSLFSDRRANESEVTLSHLRRGWIGNERTPGIEIGSKLWLYEQVRLTGSIVAAVGITASDALKWFVEDELAVSIGNVRTIVTGDGLSLELTIFRPNSSVEKKRFTLWNNTGV